MATLFKFFGMETEQVRIDSELKVTRDAFLDGKIEVLQLADRGHRSGLDAILLAAALPPGISGKLVDMGSGAGVAGLAATALRFGLQTLLVENDPDMVELARQTIKIPANRAFSARMATLEADVTLSGKKREQAGLSVNYFDFAIMNPPYNDAETNRASSDRLKVAAHMIKKGGLEAWIRTATTILKPHGMLVMIYRTQAIDQITSVLSGRFGSITIMPVHSHSNVTAKRLLVRAIKGSRAPANFAPPLIVHNDDGSFTPKAKAVLTGNEYLF